MHIADLGEIALIERLRAIVTRERVDLISGISDDVELAAIDGLFSVVGESLPPADGR
jgi:hypothetical protein